MDIAIRTRPTGPERRFTALLEMPLKEQGRRSIDIASLAGPVPFFRTYLPNDQKGEELHFTARFCELMNARGIKVKIAGPGPSENDHADVVLELDGERIHLQVGEAFDENRRRRNRIAEQILTGLWTQETASRYCGMSFVFTECGVDGSLAKLNAKTLRAIRARLLDAVEEGFRRSGCMPDGGGYDQTIEVELPGPYRVSLLYSRYATRSPQRPLRFMWILGGVFAEEDRADDFKEVLRKKIAKYPKIEEPFWLLIYSLHNPFSKPAAASLANLIANTRTMPFDKIYVMSGGSQLLQAFPPESLEHLPERQGVVMLATDCMPTFNDDRWKFPTFV